MTTYTGQSGVVQDGTNAVGEVKSFSVSVTGDVVETTVMGDAWKKNTGTQNAWTASVDVLHDIGDTNGQMAFAINSTISLKAYPAGATTGYLELSGSALVTGREIRTSHDGLVEMSLTLTGDGPLTEQAKPV